MSDTSHPQHLPDLTKSGDGELTDILDRLVVTASSAADDIAMDDAMHSAEQSLLAWRAAHQTAQTDAVVKKLEALKLDGSEFSNTVITAGIAKHNAALDTAIALLRESQPTNTIPGEE